MLSKRSQPEGQKPLKPGSEGVLRERYETTLGIMLSASRTSVDYFNNVPLVRQTALAEFFIFNLAIPPYLLMIFSIFAVLRAHNRQIIGILQCLNGKIATRQPALSSRHLQV